MTIFTFAEAAKIHYANGYDKDPKANEAFNRLSNEVNAAAFANVLGAKSFDDYADAICEIDDEPFSL